MHTTTIASPHRVTTTIEKPGTPIVSLAITVDIHDKCAALPHGALHLYSDLLISGAGKYTRNEFIHAISSLGASIDVEYNSHSITISLSSPKAQLKPALALLTTMVTTPTFLPTEVKRAQKNALDGLILAAEDARSQAVDGFLQALYSPQDRSYSIPLEELRTAITSVKRPHIVSLHTDILSRPWTVTIGGDAAALRMAAATIDRIHHVPETSRTYITPAPVTTPAYVPLITKDIPSRQNIELAIGGRVPLTLTDTDYPALVFGLAVLGKWGGFAGRLMSTVREKEGLTYGIYARTEGLSALETGHWRIMTFFAPKDVERGLLSVFREVDAIVADGITPGEHKRFKTIIATGQILLRDSLTDYVSYVHGHITKGITTEQQTALVEAMKSVSIADVNRALKTYITPKHLTISAAGPVAKQTAILKKLAHRKGK